MTNFIPIYPLSIVVFPGEELHLHVSEPPYKQLIDDCRKQEKAFGIPLIHNMEIKEFGTLTTIEQLVKVYDNGEMDVIVRGKSVFRVLEHIHEIPHKLYKGAIVHHLENRDNGRKTLMNKVLTAMRIMHQSLGISKRFADHDDDIKSFDIAHHVGLSLLQEYALLELTDELHRQEFLRRHLTKTIPVVSELERLKERIRMNGHFRRLK